jgi:ferredoxin
MFGAIPGLEKSKMHLRLKEDVNLFSQMLVDLFKLTSPYFSILDGVLALEGDGPGPAGVPREVKVLAGSCDSVALDAVGAYLIGFSPLEILTTKIANDEKLGKGNLEEIEIIGENIKNLKIKDFKHPTSPSILQRFPYFLRELGKDLFTAKPLVKKSICRGCKICEEICPAKAIKVEKYAKINEKFCIRCYCCNEVCPESAIILKTPVLGKILKYL